MKAVWKNTVLAESNETRVIENNHYFPADSINSEFFALSTTHTTCPWKGKASYFNIQVDGEKNKDAAWYYPHPKEAAAQIKNYVAFWNGIEVKK